MDKAKGRDVVDKECAMVEGRDAMDKECVMVVVEVKDVGTGKDRAGEMAGAGAKVRGRVMEAV
ncbi:hypothetical protein KAI87_13725 [Myxococcota bacterium]|nr:hypothetical protein [Myxococcota bacterium]